jgi:hypothetical protein
MKKIKPTLKQEAAFKIMLKKMKDNEPTSLGKIMKEAGYSANSAINPELNLTSKKGWEMLKRKLDASGAIVAFNDLVSAENEDKRTRLSAAVEITKIVNPEKQNNVIGLFEKIGELQNESETSTDEDKFQTS